MHSTGSASGHSTGSAPDLTGELLWIFRHGKAVPGFDMDDFDRPLKHERAGSDAALINHWITVRELPRPERLIASPAERTKQTAQLLASPVRKGATAVDPIPISYIDALYMASAQEFLRVTTDALRETPRLGVVGHNPSVSQAVAYLAGDDWAGFTGLPTLGCALFEFSDDENRFVLRAHTTPRHQREFGPYEP